MSGLVWFKDKRDAPHYFYDINAKMMIWKFYAKLVMHAPMRTLKCQICSFINLCIHPSPFRASGEISQYSPFRCRHIFSKTSYDQWIFSKKSWKSSLFKSMLVFQLDNLFFFFLFTCSLFPFLFIIFIMIFVCFIFWTMFLNEKLYTVPEFQTSLIIMI